MQFIGLIAGVISLWGVTSMAEETKPNRERHPWTLGCSPDKSVPFYQPEKGDPLKLDLFFPENHAPTEKRGCIILFFGGGWTAGATDQFYGYAKYMASRGLVAISAQYRTKSSHGAIPRQCVEDGKRAIRYVREHAKELGVDPDKIIVGGGSAGGHVAAACAMCPKIDATPDSTVSCVPNALVLFNPVYDNGPGGYGHKSVTDYWKDISPFHNIRKGLPPTVVFFGSKDSCVPVATIQAFEKQMVDAGNVCENHLYEGESHGFFHINKGGRKMFEDVLVKVDTFLVKHGYLSGENTVAKWTASRIAQLKINTLTAEAERPHTVQPGAVASAKTDASAE
jgi:acetyl esterase/lipase